MTPPVAPKMVPAPVYGPMGESGSSSGRFARSMPACLIMRASSRVVRVTSTSFWPEAYMSSLRLFSYFLAVQGMTETEKILAGSTVAFSAQ